MIVASFVYERFDDDVSRSPCVNGVIAHRLILCIVYKWPTIRLRAGALWLLLCLVLII
jgi:hypothetical protein